MPKSTRNISKETISSLSDAPTPLPGKVLQIRSGKVKTLVAEPSGIFKQVQQGRIFINEHGIGNDKHVYPIHWSTERALHQYASEHYESWRCEDGCPKPELFDYGAFGENIVGTNMSEKNVCVGDVYRIGRDVVVEVSEPRSPCYKLNLRFEWGRALKRVNRTARTGWNMRVRTAGYICAGDVMELMERPHPRWSILNIKRVIQGKDVALPLVAELCNLSVVTSMVREFAMNRLQSTPKRYAVVDITPVTSRVKHFTFQLREPFTINEPTFKEFAFAQIEFGTNDERYSRSYSIVSGDLNRFSLGVAHDDHSRGGSRYLHMKLQIGDIITMAPGGVPKAVEDEQKCVEEGLVDRRLVIIGGIGVTAFLPKIAQWKKEDIDYEVHYATRNREEAAFLNRFPSENIMLYAKNEGRRLDLDALIPGSDKDGKHTTRIYCCGPEGLMKAAQRRAREMEYPDHMLHFESFGVDSASTRGKPFTVEVNELESHRKKTLDVTPDKTLLTVLREAGFDMTFFCEMGGCGACKVTVCDGKVDHKGTALYPEEKKRNMLSCVSRGSGHIKIDYAGMTLPRVVPQGGYDIGGDHMPAGFVVGFSPWVVHRSKEEYGQDVYAFRPERWSKGDNDDMHIS
ncbi:hypothetical protein CTAM01_16849 [Colletotrichum tamarilloi]|uniref:MOSC domain-containing protein n=1 Tax=Colletotrichum tamarilloi TaxID=1209934 RepID=A0ABQ9QHC3_9PEZI|nr:uncharacterized protein CTAM01_16849 [Colletotrichum tamarilloi]KAK1470280.1 hypothetical protein CTAM01_16849 [Colletotrichum tamarilloi]